MSKDPRGVGVVAGQPEAVQPVVAEDIRAIPLRRPWRWFAVAVVAVLATMLVNTVLTNPRFRWDVVADYFTEGVILRGLSLTLQLTAISMVIGIVLGVVFALMRGSSNPVLAAAGALYIWFFRGTPLLVQLVFWFNLSALYPRLSLGVPFGPEFVIFDANDLIVPIAAAILGLGLNEGAYMAEIVRGGIAAIDRGQYQAATALGMTRMQTMRRIVLPQAMKVIIPPTGNQTIAMLKNVSLVSVLAIPDLLYSAQIIYARNFQTIPLLLVASIWYLICTSILTVIQTRIERRFTPETVVDDPFWTRFWKNATSFRPHQPRRPRPVEGGKQ